MKKLILIYSFLFISGISYAQLSIGPKVGINSSKLILDDVVSGINDGSRRVGFHIGAFGRADLGLLFVQPEIVYTSSRGEIDIDAFGITQIQEYNFNQIDVPVMVGIKFAQLFRAYGGPVASFLIGADGNEGRFNNAVLRNYNNATFGYQIGVGVDVGNLLLDLKYEDNLSKFGDAVNIGTQRFAVDQRQNQVILSLGVRLFD